VNDEDDEMTAEEAWAVLEGMFPGGPAGPEVAAELRAEGWTGGDAQEVARSIGDGLWSIFSDNHRVVAPDGRFVSLGSWRGSGDTIAEFLNARVAGCSFDDMDFYMAGSLSRGDPGASAVQRVLFRRLHDRGFDWRYTFPQIYLVRLPRPEPVEDPSDPGWKPYSPEQALQRDADDARRAAEEANLDERMERAHAEDVERARERPPPEVVQAYRAVHGHDPAGWPPWDAPPQG
jgi:hypothetical protein